MIGPIFYTCRRLDQIVTKNNRNQRDDSGEHDIIPHLEN